MWHSYVSDGLWWCRVMGKPCHRIRLARRHGTRSKRFCPAPNVTSEVPCYGVMSHTMCRSEKFSTPYTLTLFLQASAEMYMMILFVVECLV